MPENRYDNTTSSEGNATEQASRVATQQQRGNDQQQQAQAAQRAAAPDVAVQLEQTQPEREVRQAAENRSRNEYLVGELGSVDLGTSQLPQKCVGSVIQKRCISQFSDSGCSNSGRIAMNQTRLVSGYQTQSGVFARGVSDSGGCVGYADIVFYDSPPLTVWPSAQSPETNNLRRSGNHMLTCPNRVPTRLAL